MITGITPRITIKIGGTEAMENKTVSRGIETTRSGKDRVTRADKDIIRIGTETVAILTRMQAMVIKMTIEVMKAGIMGNGGTSMIPGITIREAVMDRNAASGIKPVTKCRPGLEMMMPKGDVIWIEDKQVSTGVRDLVDTNVRRKGFMKIFATGLLMMT